ncbi:exonuclease domain-containing protein [Aneurinibacillus terranovensis]|uniref:exonuclease domain-containing protein n=1 Tax=Aneurinibacillus terranovensis TaxID=278991 RepID=UPI00042890AD|nr:exonuclease domain-containing protein [Aneurinibacillus terranovensis]
MNRNGPSPGGNWRMAISRLLSLGFNRNELTMVSKGGPTAGLEHQAFIRNLLKEAGKNHQEMNTPLGDIEFIVLDTETTGFHPEHGDEIISIAAAKVVQFETVEPIFSTHINPTVPIPEAVAVLTGLSDKEVESAPRLSEVVPELLAFINHGTIVGYHIAHDIAFLNAFLWKNHRMRMTQRIIEIQKVMEGMRFNGGFTTLDDALQFFSIRPEQRHTAMGDVKMTSQLWLTLLKECGNRGIRTLQDLYILMS